MKAVLQRVTQANVTVEGQCIGQIEQGIVALVCVEPNDTEAISDKLLNKILSLRIFADSEQKMNLNLQDVQGGLLLISQFTLAADTKKGNRPGFTAAAKPEQAKKMFEQLIHKAKQLYSKVECGIFAADMQVQLTNDGPVTIPLQID